MTLPPAPQPGQKRRPPHRSYDPRLAYRPELLSEAVVNHKNGNYDRAWDQYNQLDTEAVQRGLGPHWHARMMAALLWYQRTSKIDFAVDPDLPKYFGDNYRTVTGMLRDVMLHVPLWSDVRYNLGVVLEGLGEIEEAETRFRQAVEIDSAYGEAWVNLGNCQLHKGNVEEARQCFAIAEQLNPDDALAKYNLMHAMALFGEWDEAYQRYEYRYLVPGHLRDHGLPRLVKQWDGESYVDRLVVTDEQGAGDIIQFARFLPYLEARCGKLFCRVRHPHLVSLLQSNFPRVQFFTHADRVPKADAHVPLLSCISRLQVKEAAVPTPGGYLAAERPETITSAITQGIVWQHPVSNTGTTASKLLSVGVCWAGSPTHKRDKVRSIPWADFSPILDVPGIAFTNLTVGAAAAQEHPAMVSPALTDYATTAKIIAGLDLVITCDTSVCHLAGAMGKPVWNLIGASGDMRWMMGRDDTPWFASMRLVRQPRHDDWNSVILRVRADLEKLTA